jgi:N-dimethylarginine dimethylaminohydrolase
MLRVCIEPTTFTIFDFQDKQNPYIDIEHTVHGKKVMQQHSNLQKAFSNIVKYTVDNVQEKIPDIVFIANGGLSLPRIPRTLLLPSMKYKQRRDELPHLMKIYEDLGLTMIPFPRAQGAPFEGQAELKWFHGGTKAICGYGFRSTKKTFTILDKFLHTLYTSHGLTPPELLVVRLASDNYYHLDVAMVEFDDTKCVIHKNAFTAEGIEAIEKFLGKSNVHVIDVANTFCLNAVVDGKNLITHKLSAKVEKLLEGITGKHVKQVDTSEFEKSGGSVRCMTLDLFL